jgi:ectoine hydroxylase-related dioxygenase (phytanoyl-CoA dioxygenase family)
VLRVAPGGAGCLAPEPRARQDEAYADLGPAHQLATAWVALSDSRPENGCVRFLRGSQAAGSLPHASLPRTAQHNLVLGQVSGPGGH